MKKTILMVLFVCNSQVLFAWLYNTRTLKTNKNNGGNYKRSISDTGKRF